MSLRAVALALLVAGAALMIPFDAWYTRLPGVLCLLAFVVVGVFAVAAPEDLARDEDPADAGRPTPPA
jgi:hypothetical protein